MWTLKTADYEMLSRLLYFNSQVCYCSQVITVEHNTSIRVSLLSEKFGEEVDQWGVSGKI